MTEEIKSKPEAPENKCELSSCNGTLFGYLVEAKLDCPEPERVGDTILDKEWRVVHFKEDVAGVPCRGSRYDAPHLTLHGLMSFTAAEALRWWLLAELERDGTGLHYSIQTRITSHKIEYSSKATPIVVLSEMRGTGDSRPGKA